MTDTNPPADRTAEIRARLQAATPGPWHADDGDFGCVMVGNYGWVTPAGVNAPEYDVDTPQGHADAELIAHAPTDLAYLLARVEELERQLGKARQYLLAGAVAAYVAWEIDNGKRNDLPITHSIADGSEGILRGCVRSLQDLLIVLGEVKGDEECSETWAILGSAIAAGKPKCAPDSEMDPFEAADDIHRRWGS
jgi:hypothetical protein